MTRLLVKRVGRVVEKSLPYDIGIPRLADSLGMTG